MAPQPPLPNFGRYETLGILGRGAFGTVYEAVDPALDSAVAIKVLADNFSTDADTRQRFIKEARFLRRIGTDRLVSVYDIGEKDGQPYFVMELVPGGTLAERLGSRDLPLSRADLRRMTTELSAALRAIHDAGVIHRDIKPSNLLIQGGSPPDDGALLGADERIVLGDFGLARDVDGSAFTIAGGTLGFMSPEQQVPGTPVDERTDIYAATAVIAHLAEHSEVQLTPPVAWAFESGMQPNPADRPEDAAKWESVVLTALVDAPATVANQSPLPPPSPRAATAPPPPAAASMQETAARVPPPTTAGPVPDSPPLAKAPSGRTSKLAPIAIVGSLLALLLVVIVGGNLLLRGGDSGPAIVGPAQIEVGAVVTYQAEVAEGLSYYWTDWEGSRHDGPALEVSAESVGILPITLTEVRERDDNERSRELVIRVVVP